MEDGTPRSSAWLAPGEPVTLDNCAREPIHLPGRIQAHGGLLVVELASGEVTQVSANVAALLGFEDEDASALLGRTLEDVVGAGTAEALLTLPRQGPPAIRPRRVATDRGVALETQCFLPDERLLGIDLELAEDDGGKADPGPAIAARAAAWGAAFAVATDAGALVAEAAAALRRLTGFDRVWAYRFEADGHGVVVAEDERPDLGRPSFLGLHFPESDIPAQARALYRTAGARVIGDSEQGDWPLLPECSPVTGDRLDLSGSDLRGVSPMHVRYLRNMGVRTSMSVPLLVEGELWGLLSAHAYDEAQPVPFRTRSECELLGTMTSLQLESALRQRHAEERLRLEQHLHGVVNGIGGAADLADGLAGAGDDLRALPDAEGVVVQIGESRTRVGATPGDAELDAILAAIQAAPGDLVVTDRLRDLDPSLATSAPSIAGVVAVALSRAHRNWIVWTRPEQVREVTWANRDRELVRRDPAGALDLGERESFERWIELVEGSSRPWTRAQLRVIDDLRAAIGAHAIAQAEHLAERNEALRRVNAELDAFAYSAAHDLRQPVRAITMRAGFLLDDAAGRLTEPERESIETMIKLSGRMNGLVDSLLDYAKLDYSVWRSEAVQLEAVVRDAVELMGDPAALAGLDVRDATLRADPDALRQVLFNLIWNANKYSDGDAKVTIGTVPFSQAPTPAAAASLHGLSEVDPDVVFVQDEGIGIEPEHLETIFGLFRRLHPDGAYGGGSGAGLALCRRVVERTGGMIWATSTVGRGSTFWFTFGSESAGAAA